MDGGLRNLFPKRSSPIPYGTTETSDLNFTFELNKGAPNYFHNLSNEALAAIHRQRAETWNTTQIKEEGDSIHFSDSRATKHIGGPAWAGDYYLRKTSNGAVALKIVESEQTVDFGPTVNREIYCIGTPGAVPEDYDADDALMRHNPMMIAPHS